MVTLPEMAEHRFSNLYNWQHFSNHRSLFIQMQFFLKKYIVGSRGASQLGGTF